MTHNNETPRQPFDPDIQVGHRNGSTIKVYNVAQLTDGSPERPQRVFADGSLLGEMQYASLVTCTDHTEDGDTVLAMNFTMQADGMRADSELLSSLQGHMLADRHNYYEVCKTSYSNVLSIRTERGLGVLVYFDDKSRQLVVSNNWQVQADGMRGASIAPTPLRYLGADMQLIEMGRIMADVLSYEPSDPSAYRDWPGKGRLIEIGKNLRQMPSSSDQATLGKNAVAGTEESDPSAPVEFVELDDSTEVRLSDIGGHESIKTTFRRISLLRRHPEVAAKYKTPLPRSVLLYGNPGTGKDMLAHALANELGAVIREIQGDEIFGKYLGDAERNMQRIFDELNAAAVPTLALWNEFDASMNVPERIDSGADQTRNAATGIFKQQMDKLNPNVFVVAITNNLDNVPLALRRKGRFDYQLHVQMPNAEERLAIMWNIVSKYLTVEVAADNSQESTLEPVALSSPLFDSAIDWYELAHRTDGMSGAEITEVFRRITQSKALDEIENRPIMPATQADIMGAIASVLSDGAD